MPVFKFIENLQTRRKFGGLNQSQNEALIDALTAAKAIDGELREVERKELLDVMDMLEWKGAQSMAAYIEEAVELAQSIEPVGESLTEFFSDVGRRLEEQWLREEAYYLSSRVALADEQVVESERLLLKYMVKAFDIPSDRQQTIIAKLRREM